MYVHRIQTHAHTNMCIGRQTDRHRDRQTERQIDRHTDRQTQTDRQTDTQTHRQTNRQTDMDLLLFTFFGIVIALTLAPLSSRSFTTFE